jgi:PleD family two-component response regulator
MPDMLGYAVCEHLKGNRATADIPIIFVTSLEDEEDEAKGLEMGAVDYITKPYRIPIIKARVRIHTQLRQHQRFIESLLKDKDKGIEQTKLEARALLRQIGNE